MVSLQTFMFLLWLQRKDAEGILWIRRAPHEGALRTVEAVRSENGIPRTSNNLVDVQKITSGIHTLDASVHANVPRTRYLPVLVGRESRHKKPRSMSTVSRHHPAALGR